MSNTVAGMPNCLECDSLLDPAIAGGLCPKCLLKLGVDNTTFFGMGTGPAAKAAAPVEAPAAVKFGAYRVVHLLGKGGMGSVYEVEQEGTGRRLALKVLGQSLDNPQLRARFLREGQLAAAVRHPHVVGIIAAEEIEGVPVIAMELLHQGNLAEKVKREGPLPPAQAVEAVLQIIDGLQAAQTAGVLHRDVKPANCFISADGVVKVGDFGLSISTLAQGDLTLTLSGMTLGTPTFAAPEQLRGEDLDLRADIYSVGATLYYLLTGQVTHKADNVGALIAAVLTKTPADPSTLRPGIPAALARVVMRCLEREAARRPKSYETLRAALLPFSMEAPAPGMLGLRFIAGVVDLAVISLCVELPAFLLLPGPWADAVQKPGTAAWLLSVALTILYYALMEWRWGATPGKLLCGLRVRRAGGDLPGFGTAALRALVFCMLPKLPDLLAQLVRAPGAWGLSIQIDMSGETLASGASILSILLFFALFVSMRRRNGYAALQDLVSRTRVVMAPEAEEDAGIPAAALSGADTGERIGPFAVVARHGVLVEAWDPSLRRMLWLLQREPGTPPLRERRRDLDRPARLHWLQSIQRDGEEWDVFEAPPGQALAMLAGRNQPWNRVRRWLLDLAQEFSTSARRGERLEAAGLNRVWITAQGRAIWLDFPLPSGGREFQVTDHASLQEFLAAIAAGCLAPDPPLHAGRLVETFAQQRLETPDLIVGNLRASMEWPGKLTWRQRLLSLLLWPLLALVMSAFAAVGLAPEITGEIRTEMADGLKDLPGQEAADALAEIARIYSGPVPGLGLVAATAAILLMLGVGVNFVWAIATGVPPGLQLYGLVLTRAGKVAGRIIVVTRTFFTCMAMSLLAGNLVLAAVLAFGVPRVFLGQDVALWLWCGCGTVFLLLGGIALHACLRPQRALIDLVLGTTIVPR